MQNIRAILAELGIEVPEDKEAELNAKLSENYVTKAEHAKKIARAEADRDNWKTSAESAEETLKKFEGIDPAEIQAEINGYKERAQKAEADYNRKIEERDFADALHAELDKIQFTSAAAKRAVTSEVMNAGLKLSNGKILGLSDLIEQIRESDESAFVDVERQKTDEKKPRFTAGTGRPTSSAVTRDQFAAMTLDKRLELKKTDPDLYRQLKG